MLLWYEKRKLEPNTLEMKEAYEEKSRITAVLFWFNALLKKVRFPSFSLLCSAAVTGAGASQSQFLFSDKKTECLKTLLFDVLLADHNLTPESKNKTSQFYVSS